VVRDDVDDAQACKTLAHELAHVMLHETESGMVGADCRGRKEVEAESVAYVVCNAAGLTTEAYSAAYVARWAGGDVRAVRETAERVVATAQEILSGLEVTA
jgi:antirestriction protein ArdC